MRCANRFYSAVARTAFKGESQQSLHHFWYFPYPQFVIYEHLDMYFFLVQINSDAYFFVALCSREMVAYIANTLIFILR